MKLSAIFPCASFVRDGYYVRAFVSLVMQASFLFWPAAAAWAAKSHKSTRQTRMLDHKLQEYATTYGPLIPERMPAKSFRGFRGAY